MLDTAKQVTKGLLTYAPGAERLFKKTTGTTGEGSARYCYSVWLRHYKHAMGKTVPPRTVAELGPGDSLGVGLAALLSGAESYLAFDVHDYATDPLPLFDEIAGLFRNRTPVPTEFPAVKPHLTDHRFPDVPFDEDRVAVLRRDLASRVRYVVDGSVEPGTVDWVISQAVLEHVDDLDLTYRSLFDWLRPGGFASHQIDFKSHGLTREWNGHWALSDRTWRAIRGRRPWLLNRVPLSGHLKSMKRAGFAVVNVVPVRETGLPRERMRIDVTDEDLTTSGALVQAVKPQRPSTAAHRCG